MTLAMPFDAPPAAAPPSRPRRRLTLVDGAWPERPRTRGECDDVPRPCPFVSCRYHLYIYVQTEDAIGPRVVVPKGHPASPLDMPPRESCALDVVEDSGPLAQLEVGRLLGFRGPDVRATRRRAARTWAIEGVRRIEVRAKETLKERYPEVLEALLEEFASEPHDFEPGTIAEAIEYFGDAEEAPTPAGREDALDAWIDDVLANLRAGMRLRDAWSAANDKENEMAAKKGKKAKKKAAVAAKANGAAAIAPVLRQGVERARFHEDLPVSANDAEMSNMTASAGSLVGQIETLETEARESAKQFRAKLKSLRARERELGKRIRANVCMRPVQCVDRLIVETNEMQTVRTDTGEIIRTRPASDEDRQLDLAMQQREAAGRDEKDDDGDFLAGGAGS